jgi:hypothetical protein
MATQLTRRSWRSALTFSGPSITIQPRYAAIGGVICILVVYAAMFASMRTSATDEEAAEARYLDTMQLLTVPPVPIATLEAELSTAQNRLALVENSATHSSIDPASDEATAMLVRRATEAGLSVTSVARLNRTQTQIAGISYDVEALRMGLHGPSQDAIIALLSSLFASDPALTPALTSLTVEDSGVTAEIVFSMFSLIEPTSVAPQPESAR